MKPTAAPDHVLHEITPLMEKDVLYIADRHKKEFTYPIHNHEVFELNFIEHAPGVRRIVGDSSEVIGEYDLVLITSLELEHVWMQNSCVSQDIHEITVQFKFDLSSDSLFSKNPFQRIYRMLNEARKGLAFPMDAIMKVYNDILALSTVKDGFEAFISFLNILDKLSRDQPYLEEVLSPLAEKDEFIKKNLEISKKVAAFEHKQKIQLGIFRNDYVVDKNTPLYKMVKYLKSGYYVVFYVMDNNKIVKVVTEQEILKMIESNNIETMTIDRYKNKQT